MSITYGLTPTGFVPKSVNQIVLEMQISMQSDLGQAIDMSDGGPLGQVMGVFAGMLGDLWQQCEGVVMSQSPDTAEGQSLDNVRSLNNILREAPEPSTVTETITGANGTVILGTDTSSTPFQMSVAGTNHQAVFQAIQTVTITGGTAQVPMACTENGPTPAPMGTLTVIETPTAGISSGTNAADAVLGALLEDDPDYRLRSLQELQRSEAGTVEGIRSTLLETIGVNQAGVTENITDASVDGLLPHSFESFANGGTDAAVSESVWLSKPAGIATDGSSSATVVDSQGVEHTIYFARPMNVPLYFIINITQDTDPADGISFPSDGVAEVTAALVNYLAGFTTGQNGLNPKFAAVITDAVAGIETLQVLVGIAPAPGSSATVVASFNELLTLDGSNITVNVT